MQYDGKDFVGVKAALYYDGNILVYRRDDKPGLRFAGMWDFFGGGREGEETPIECLVRELYEELEINIRPEQVVFTRVFPAMHDPTLDAYFMAVELSDDQAKNFRFGSEGVECKFVATDDFMADNQTIPDLKPRLVSYLNSRG